MNQLPNPFAQNYGQPMSSQDAGPSNWNQNQRNSDYNAQDRNANYRPKMGLNRFNNNRNIIKMTNTNFKNRYKNNYNRGSTHVQKNPTTTLSVAQNFNPRNKGIIVSYTRQREMNFKIILYKISDDLKINLTGLKVLGFKKGESETELKIVMIFHRDQEPYTKVIEIMDEIENKMLAGENISPSEFHYDGPRDLKAPLVSGDIYASVRPSETLFPLKLSKSTGETSMAEAIEMLENWRDTRFCEKRTLIEESVHSIRLSYQEIVISFNDLSLRDDCKDLLSRNLGQYEVTSDTHPTVISASQGATRRRNGIKISPEMLKTFQAIGNLSPQMIECFKLLGTGKFILVEQDDDTVIANTTERLNHVSLENPMETETFSDTRSMLPAPINPVKLSNDKNYNR